MLNPNEDRRIIDHSNLHRVQPKIYLMKIYRVETDWYKRGKRAKDREEEIRRIDGWIETCQVKKHQSESRCIDADVLDVWLVEIRWREEIDQTDLHHAQPKIYLMKIYRVENKW